MKFCHNCKTPWQEKRLLGMREECEECGSDMHVCLNCRFYDTHKPNSCQVETEPVLKKDRGNFCDEFQFKDVKENGSSVDETLKARENFKNIFKS